MCQTLHRGSGKRAWHARVCMFIKRVCYAVASNTEIVVVFVSFPASALLFMFVSVPIAKGRQSG